MSKNENAQIINKKLLGTYIDIKAQNSFTWFCVKIQKNG